MVNFEFFKLSELAEVIVSGVDKKSKPGQKEVRLCNFTDVYYNWAITSSMYNSFMVATAKNKEIETLSIKKGYVALTKDSETRYDMGLSTYIADDFDGVVLGYHCALIKPNCEILCGKYLNCLLHTQYARTYFANNAKGSGQRYSLTQDCLNGMKIPLPMKNGCVDIDYQEFIGNLFSSIDRKIEINQQINRNLEELARLIYDYWFVQFDFPNKNGKPYKSSGGKMVWNEKLKRNIPAGWQTAKVRDVILPIERGISYSSDEITDPNGTPMINLACFDKKGNYRTGEFKYFTGKFKNEDKIYPFDMLIACTDLTQKADIIGTPIFSPTEYPFYVFSMDLVKITPIRSNDKQFLYYYLKHPAFHHYIKPFASGTTVKHLRVDGLLDYPIFMPDESVRDAFAEVMEPIRHKIADNTSQGVELSKMRDYLLPLLMNGQVSVKSSNGSK